MFSLDPRFKFPISPNGLKNKACNWVVGDRDNLQIIEWLVKWASLFRIVGMRNPYCLRCHRYLRPRWQCLNEDFISYGRCHHVSHSYHFWLHALTRIPLSRMFLALVHAWNGTAGPERRGITGRGHTFFFLCLLSQGNQVTMRSSRQMPTNNFQIDAIKN